MPINLATLAMESIAVTIEQWRKGQLGPHEAMAIIQNKIKAVTAAYEVDDDTE